MAVEQRRRSNLTQLEPAMSPANPPLPDNMKYVSTSGSGAAEVMHLATGPLPAFGDNDVLIKVAYAGVNRPDVAQRSGSYAPPPGASPIMGLEVSGTIVAVGAAVTQWRIGDAVCALTPGGGYAEYCAAPAAHCLPVPGGMSMLEAAGVPENFFTVWVNVFDTCKLKAGESLLVHGGSSGIGLTAIQLAKAFGATVFTTVGNDEKAAYLPSHRRGSCLQLQDSGLGWRNFCDHTKEEA